MFAIFGFATAQHSTTPAPLSRVRPSVVSVVDLNPDGDGLGYLCGVDESAAHPAAIVAVFTSDSGNPVPLFATSF
ncbi:hypothetical protein [Bradyrhizobium sp. 5.13L]